MKKLPLICVIITSLASCSVNYSKIKSEKFVTADKNGIIFEEGFIEFNKEGKELSHKRINSRNNYYWHRSTVYNIDGKESEIVDYNNDGSIYHIIKCEYNSGKLTKESVYNFDKKIIRYYVYEHPSSTLTLVTCYNYRDKIIETGRDVFDEKGRIVERKFFNSRGKITGKRKFTYKKDNSFPALVTHAYIGKSIKKIQTNDDCGNLISEFEYVNGKLKKEIKYKNEYDVNNNLLSYTIYLNGKPDVSKRFIYSKENNKLVKTVILYDSNKMILEKGESEFTFYN